MAVATPAADPLARLTTVRGVIAQRIGQDGPLLPILDGVQEALGHVPREAVPEIASALNLSRAEVRRVEPGDATRRKVPS